MSDKKQLVILYAIVMAVIVGGTIWMSHEIDKRVVLEKPTSAVDIQAFCNEALEPTPEFCIQSTLKVVNNYDSQVTADVHILEPKVSDAYLQGGYDAN